MSEMQEQLKEVERLRKALYDIANARPIGGHCHYNSMCSVMEGIAIAALSIPSPSV